MSLKDEQFKLVVKPHGDRKWSWEVQVFVVESFWSNVNVVDKLPNGVCRHRAKAVREGLKALHYWEAMQDFDRWRDTDESRQSVEFE